jgi:hypothetical protein
VLHPTTSRWALGLVPTAFAFEVACNEVDGFPQVAREVDHVDGKKETMLRMAKKR